MLFDLPLPELEKYKPAREEPADFDRFWAETLAEARRHPLTASFSPVDTGLRLMQTYDASFAGFGGQTIKAWLVLPAGTKKRLPCVVEYIGYGGGRGLAIDHLRWAAAGYAHFVMDTRGQGSVWGPGDTPDPEPDGSNPHCPGFMTRGVLDPKTYYYRRVFTDSVRAVEAARSFDLVDPARIALTGGSQGGGITLAAAGLMPDVSAALPDVPFLCHMRTATEITDADPYREIAGFCKTHRDKVDTVFRVLQYFDGVNFASRARCPALFSAGLMDDTCPPRTVFAAYNHYAGRKDIRVYRYNRHEGGQSFQEREKIAFLGKLWGK